MASLLLVGGLGHSQARVWTDVDGRKVDAELLSQDETQIVIKLKNGKTGKVPLTKLSAADLAYLKELRERAKTLGTSASGGTEAKEGRLNWEDPWPDAIVFKGDPEIEIVEEDKEKKRFVYTSANYRFTCDVRLSKSVIGTFADMFEATRLYCLALPLAISGGKKNDGKYDILLFETQSSYYKAGGPVGSGGVFMPDENTVMVPLTSLGVRKVGSSYMRDRDKSDATLIHEITHQLCPEEYYEPGARGWFSEGIAEYLTATPYRGGRFKVRSNMDEIVDYITTYGEDDAPGRALGKEIKAPPLKNFMLMRYEFFAGGPGGNFNYGFGLLLTTYFLHFDGEKDGARMKEFLKQLRKDGEDPMAAINKLLDGRTFEELQDDVRKGWRTKGVRIEFMEPK